MVLLSEATSEEQFLQEVPHLLRARVGSETGWQKPPGQSLVIKAEEKELNDFQEVILQNHISPLGPNGRTDDSPANLLNYPTPLGRSASIPMLTDPFALTGCGFRNIYEVLSLQTLRMQPPATTLVTSSPLTAVAGKSASHRSDLCGVGADTSVLLAFHPFSSFMEKTHGNSRR